MKRIVLIVVAACLACGSSSNNPDGGSTPANGVSGSVDGHALNVQDAVFTIASGGSLEVPDGTVVLVLGDRANLCSIFGSTTPPTGDATILALALVNASLSGLQPLAAGPYGFIDLNNPPTTIGSYWGGFLLTGPVCGVPTEYDPTAGSTLNLTQVGTASGTHLKANFSSLTFGTQGSFTSGTIDATYCAALNNSVNPCLGAARTPFPVVLPRQ